MKRHATSSAAAVLLAALLAVACGGESAPDLPGDPPTEESASIPAPRDLSALDPALADRVRAALAELRADESDPARWMALGMTYEANEMGSLAIECYLRVVSDPAPTLPKLLQAKAWSRLAQTYGVLGDVEHAIEAMRHSIEAVPDYAPSHWRLGTYLFDWGDFDAARASFRRATELDPKHSGGWIGLARIHLQEDRPELAVQILTKLLAGKPKDSDALRLLRTAYIQAGRAEEAAGLGASWKRKSSPGKDPWHREFRAYREKPLMERALAALQGGKAEEALPTLEDFARERPDDLNVLSFLAWGRFLVGDEQGAWEAIHQGLEVDPDSILILRVEARIQESSGDPSAAIETLAHILRIEPNDTQALRKAGRLEREAGNGERAAELWLRFLELDGSDPEIWRASGEVLLDLERWEDAEEVFRGARRHRVNDASIRAGLARALAAQERWDEAESVLLEGGGPDAPSRPLLESIRAHESP